MRVRARVRDRVTIRARDIVRVRVRVRARDIVRVRVRVRGRASGALLAMADEGEQLRGLCRGDTREI